MWTLIKRNSLSEALSLQMLNKQNTSVHLSAVS